MISASAASQRATAASYDRLPNELRHAIISLAASDPRGRVSAAALQKAMDNLPGAKTYINHEPVLKCFLELQQELVKMVEDGKSHWPALGLVDTEALMKHCRSTTSAHELEEALRFGDIGRLSLADQSLLVDKCCYEPDSFV